MIWLMHTEITFFNMMNSLLYWLVITMSYQKIKMYMIRKAGWVMLPLEKRHIFTGEAY